MFEVFQNGPDGVRIRDVRDDPQCAAAVRAHGNIDFKYALQALSPGQRRGRPHLIDSRFDRGWCCRLLSFLASRFG